MSTGPITIFDKSAIQGLSLDEAVRFGQFYRIALTPIFFVETLADLEKKVREGQTPEQVVPTTNAQRIAVFAYYRDNYENKARFGRGDLESYFGQARLDSPGNYDRDFSVAVEKGWIHEKGDESYITTSGIEAVERGFEGERTYTKRAGPKKTAVKKAPTTSKRTNAARRPAAKRR